MRTKRPKQEIKRYNTNISSSTTDERPYSPTSRHKVKAEIKIEEERME